VEFHQDGRVIPVEYKRGKPKAHPADEVQLCAQALCLEETLHLAIPVGYLFYGKPRRRTEVAFDEPLRDRTRATAADFHRLMSDRRMPEPIYESKKCGACSLKEICLPQVPRFSSDQFSRFLRKQLSMDN